MENWLAGILDSTFVHTTAKKKNNCKRQGLQVYWGYINKNSYLNKRISSCLVNVYSFWIIRIQTGAARWWHVAITLFLYST